LWLAAGARAPLVPVGSAASPALRFPRWDRLLVPIPGARTAVVVGAPLIDVDPRSAHAGARLAATLDRLSLKAQALVGKSGGLPGDLEEAA
jgi:lysophospholipid acyltransferase (LPLAT)-like uncharacterized protein